MLAPRLGCRRLSCPPAASRRLGLGRSPTACRLAAPRPLQSAAGDKAEAGVVLSDQRHDDDLLTRDELKEGSRKYQRTLSSFTWERWASHRSTWRYLRHMRGIFKSSIVRGLQQPLLYVGSLATMVCFYEQLLQDGSLPGVFPSLQIPTAPFDLTTFALALLLVFRTNTSYDRFEDVCSLWGSMANRSRDIMRQLLAGGLRGSADSPLPPAMFRWVVAFTRALKAQLTEDSDLRAELQGILEPAELDQLCASWHPPSFALAVLSELVGHAGASGLREVQCTRLDETLSAFEDVVGACERILRTPIPLSYTRHTSRFLVIYLSALPLGLWSGCHWATIPLAMVIAFLLLGIEEIGVQIEEPFGLLPLEDLCHEIEGDLFGMLRESTAAKATAASAATAAAAGVGGQGMERAASNIASNIEAIARRKVDSTRSAVVPSGGLVAGSSGAGKYGVPSGVPVEWAEMSGRARQASVPAASADAIFSSLDEGEV